MPYDIFQERPDGAYDFTDSATGQTIALPPTPAVRARVAALGLAKGRRSRQASSARFSRASTNVRRCG